MERFEPLTGRRCPQRKPPQWFARRSQRQIQRRHPRGELLSLGQRGRTVAANRRFIKPPGGLLPSAQDQRPSPRPGVRRSVRLFEEVCCSWVGGASWRSSPTVAVREGAGDATGKVAGPASRRSDPLIMNLGQGWHSNWNKQWLRRIQVVSRANPGIGTG